MNLPTAQEGSTPNFRLAMSYRLHLFASGDLTCVEFLDVRDFGEAKDRAAAAVITCRAEQVELHDESAGLVFTFPDHIN
jgi:hypothetical protein